MANNLSFFAIHVDDLARGRRFYEQVFGWRFEPWGPPGFYLIHTGDDPSHAKHQPGETHAGVLGAMHKRREPLSGTGMRGFECTIAVDDIDGAIRAIEENGGKIGMAKFTIPTVGTGCYFHDTEGNWVGAMQYETPPDHS